MDYEFGGTERRWAWSSRQVIPEFNWNNWGTTTLPGEYESHGAEQNWDVRLLQTVRHPALAV
jgi:hypothetical protein